MNKNPFSNEKNRKKMYSAFDIPYSGTAQFAW